MKKCKLLSLLFASALLFGCASDDVDLDNMTAEQLYNRAHDYLDETRYKKAAETFEKVELEYPYSRWATDAKIMGAYAYYKNESYDDAVMALDRFIRFHPGNPNVAYAYYLKAICYYDQISDVNREQGETAGLWRPSISWLPVFRTVNMPPMPDRKWCWRATTWPARKWKSGVIISTRKTIFPP